MIRFDKRVSIPEKMDELDLPEAELQLALSDIRKVNLFLGGHKTSLRGFRSVLSMPVADTPKSHKGLLTVVDMGCGDGEFLRFLASHCRSAGQEANFVGWDFNPKSLAMARQASEAFPEIRFECRDVLTDADIPENSVIICNLFLHHFTNGQIADMLNRWKKAGATAVIINDLHRNALAYYLFRLFGAIFMRSPVARYDGAVSIRRGFRKHELKGLLSQVQGSNLSIRWRWAFRWLCLIRLK